MPSRCRQPGDRQGADDQRGHHRLPAGPASRPVPPMTSVRTSSVPPPAARLRLRTSRPRDPGVHPRGPDPVDDRSDRRRRCRHHQQLHGDCQEQRQHRLRQHRLRRGPHACRRLDRHLSRPSVALAPGASANATLAVASPTTAAAGSYGIGTGVSSSVGSVHTASASSSYSVAAATGLVETSAPARPRTSPAKRSR